jgi:hypothetical protein
MSTWTPDLEALRADVEADLPPGYSVEDIWQCARLSCGGDVHALVVADEGGSREERREASRMRHRHPRRRA